MNDKTPIQAVVSSLVGPVAVLVCLLGGDPDLLFKDNNPNQDVTE